MYNYETYQHKILCITLNIGIGRYGWTIHKLKVCICIPILKALYSGTRNNKLIFAHTEHIPFQHPHSNIGRYTFKHADENKGKHMVVYVILHPELY